MKNFICKLSMLLLISVSGVSATDRDEADAPLGGAVPALAPLPAGSKDEGAKTAAVHAWEAMKGFRGTPDQLCDAAFSLVILGKKDLALAALISCIRREDVTPSILYYCAGRLETLGESGLEVEALLLYQRMVASAVSPTTGLLNNPINPFLLDHRGNAATRLTQLRGVSEAEVLWRSLWQPPFICPKHRFAIPASRALGQIDAERRGEDPGSQGSP